MFQPLPNFLQTEIDYLETLCLGPEDLSYLLLRGTVDSRWVKKNYTENSNFGSARYSGDVAVYAAPNVFLGSGLAGSDVGAQRHGEREAFVALIKNSIKKGVGPFDNIKKIQMEKGRQEAVDDYIEKIPNILKIEELTDKYKEIGEALKNSEKIEIYTEREPCHWCEQYLAELNKLVNGKLQVFYSVPQNNAGTELLGIYTEIVGNAKKIFYDKDDIKKRQKQRNDLVEYIKETEDKFPSYKSKLDEVLKKLSNTDLTSKEKADLETEKTMWMAFIKNAKDDIERHKKQFIEQRHYINSKIFDCFIQRLVKIIPEREEKLAETSRKLNEFKGDEKDNSFKELKQLYEHQTLILTKLNFSLTQVRIQEKIDSKKISEDLESFLNSLRQREQDTKDRLETENLGISSDESLVANLRKRERREREEHSDNSDQSPESSGSFLRGWENYQDSFTGDFNVPSKSPSELKNELLEALYDMKTRQDLSTYKLEKSQEEDNVWEVQKADTSTFVGTIRIHNEYIQFYHKDNPEDQNKERYTELIKKSKYLNLFSSSERPRFS